MIKLRLLKETTASSVSSASIKDVFSSDFDIYKIVFRDLHNANQKNFNMRYIDSGGSVISAGNYDIAKEYQYSHATYYEVRATNQTEWELGHYDVDAAASGIGSTIYIFNPYSSSHYTFMMSESFYYEQIGGGANASKEIGVLKQKASMTGLNFFLDSAATITSFKVACYGLRRD